MTTHEESLSQPSPYGDASSERTNEANALIAHADAIRAFKADYENSNALDLTAVENSLRSAARALTRGEQETAREINRMGERVVEAMGRMRGTEPLLDAIRRLSTDYGTLIGEVQRLEPFERQVGALPALEERLKEAERVQMLATILVFSLMTNDHVSDKLLALIQVVFEQQDGKQIKYEMPSTEAITAAFAPRGEPGEQNPMD